MESKKNMRKLKSFCLKKIALVSIIVFLKSKNIPKITSKATKFVRIMIESRESEDKLHLLCFFLKKMDRSFSKAFKWLFVGFPGSISRWNKFKILSFNKLCWWTI